MLYRYSKPAVLCVAVLFSHLAFANGDIERGRALADTCEGCHAVDSYNNVYPTYKVPRIAGQSTQYLTSALKAYRSGERNHDTMVAQAASMSDQDIADLAAYIASLAELSEEPAAAAAAPPKSNTCAACHGPAGVSMIAQNPTLAGQHEDYLLETLRQYREGERTGANATIMQTQIMSLSDADLAEIIAYFAEQSSGLAILPRD